MNMMLAPNRNAAISGGALAAEACLRDRTPRTNDHRAREVDALMQVFYGMTGVNPSPEADGPETALGDLIAHLLHWSGVHGVDFDERLDWARRCYRDELAEEDEA